VWGRSWVTIALSAACGRLEFQSVGTTLDCGWVTSEQNCWLSLLEEVSTCAVPASSFGTFDAARTTCTYAEGWQVEFDQPFPPTDNTLRLAVSQGGTPCLRFSRSGGSISDFGLELADGAGRAVSATLADGTYTLTCRDGGRHVTRNLFPLLGCGEPEFAIPYALNAGISSLAIPIDQDLEVPLFDCKAPAAVHELRDPPARPPTTHDHLEVQP
jgi:hypothetical protein